MSQLEYKEEDPTAGSGQSRGTKWIIVAAVTGLLLVLLWEPIVGWFDLDRKKTDSMQETGPRLSDETLGEIRTALGAYEQVRLLLVGDTVDGLGFHAEQIAASLRAAREYGLDPEVPLAQHLEQATAAADRLGRVSELEEARTEFALLSESLSAAVGATSQLRGEWFLFSCPMVEGPNLWMQPNDDLANPFMGSSMLGCGSLEPWPEDRSSAASSGEDHLHLGVEGEEIAHWTCPMHPSVKQSGPGGCPICGMDLLPVSRRDVESGVLLVDESARRRIGVSTTAVTRQQVDLMVRAVGRTTIDESRLRDVTLKLDGWVERLFVNETGQAVRKGQTLLTIYSPELYAAQQEYLLALRSRHAARETSAPDRADYLVRAAREKLRLWDLSDAQIRAIEQKGEPVKRMPVLSPFSGFVIEKDVVEGAAVKQGQRLYRIAALDQLWVEADVYEKDLSNVQVGQRALITFPSVPGTSIAGQIKYVYPYLDPTTRTGRVRIQVANAGLELRPEMFANVEIRIDRGVRTVVPESAVIRTGPRELVFVDLGEGRLEPREVRLGARGDDVYEVISGLEVGEIVVTSANFLVSSESRLKSASDIWENDRAN